MLHYTRELHRIRNFKVIEPGVVRGELLRFRAIMREGPSLAVTDLITSPSSLGVDLVLFGRVFDYQDSGINPKVDYSIQVLEKQSRKVVFGARTFSNGDKGVYFFNLGRVYTAHNLAEEMTRTIVQLLSARKSPTGTEDEFVMQNLPGAENQEQGADAVVTINWYNGVNLF